MTAILVKGSSGFLGHALCSAFLALGRSVRAAVRSADSNPSIDGNHPIGPQG